MVVATADRLYVSELHAADWNWLRRPAPEESVYARVRYRASASRVAKIHEGEALRLELSEAAHAVASGQAIALYGGEGATELLGGGRLVLPEG